MEVKDHKVARFKVTFNGEDKTSKKYKLKGCYTLLLTEVAITLCDQKAKDVVRIIYEWPYTRIRDYGSNEKCFYIQSGQMYKNGEPVFAFPTTEGDAIFKLVDEHIENRLKEKTESGLSYVVTFNERDETSKRYTLKGKYSLVVTDHSLRLFPESSDEHLFEWEFIHIKQFAQTDTYFVIEVERENTPGCGIFYMHTKKGLSLCAVLQMWKDIHSHGKTIAAGAISFA